MQWLIDLVIEAIGIPPVFIDRGDFAPADFQVADFIRDNAWHDLDLSGIVPEGGTAAAISIGIRATVIANTIRFTPSDFTGDDNRSIFRTQVANLLFDNDGTLVLNAARKVRYKATAGNWAQIQLNIKGWWL